MTHPLPPLSQALIWRRRGLVFAVLSLLGGCGTPNGDFGEVQPYLVGDNVHDWVGPYAAGSVASKFDLTDDERALRDLSYPLIEAPYERQQWYAVAAEYGRTKPDRRAVDRTLYAKCLLSSEFRSPTARYAQLTDDIRNDIARIPQFFETAGRVLDMDQKRQKSMAYVSTLPPQELQNAQRRMRENQSIIALVHAKLTQRAASYHFALERLVIETPSALAVDVERASTQMQAMIERYRGPAPTWVREQNLVTVR
ncbi:MAG TPA: hypothetical protein VFC45_08620 [Pseudolabrys sp.]|nr:hypothetical protein [Pseudolabrys sp.]